MNAIKLIYFGIIITSLLSCGQKELAIDSSLQLIPDSTIYEVINSVLNNQIHSDDIPSCNRIAESDLNSIEFLEGDSLTLIKMDSLFSPEDIKFIYAQRKFAKDFKLKKEFVKGVTIIPVETLNNFRYKGTESSVQIFWENYYNKYGLGGFCTISLPLFSKDKSIAIINISMNCGGLCGYGSTKICKRQSNGEWVLIDTIDRWIS